jgi:hypothetical protein
MRLLVMLLCFLPASAMASPEGKWSCRFDDPAMTGTLGIQFVGEKLIFSTDNGRSVVENAAISDDYVFFVRHVEYEFFPKENRMNRISEFGTDHLTCVRSSL